MVDLVIREGLFGALLAALLGPVGSILGASLEASVTLLDWPGVSRGSVGALLGCLGVLLVCLGALLASPGASSGALGGLWAPLGSLFGVP